MRIGIRARSPGERAGWPIDPAIAILAALVSLIGVVSSDPTVAYEYADGDGAHLVLAAASGLALWWRRTRPLTAFVACTAVVGLVAAFEWRLGAMPFAWLAAAYAMGAYASIRRGIAGIAFAVAIGAALVIRGAPYFESWLVLGTLGQLLLIWLLGCAVHARRQSTDRARARTLEAVRISGFAAEEAARAERRRVARELHDSVTNSLSVVAVQAAAIRREFPQTLGEPLGAVEESSRAALADLRRLLGALREAPGPSDCRHRTSSPTDDLEASVIKATGWQADTTPRRQKQPLLTSEWPVDIAVGVGVAAINVTGSFVPDSSAAVAPGDPVEPVLVLLAAAPGLSLIFRRRHALVALAVTLGSLLMIVALGWQVGNLPGTVLIASFAVAAWSPARHGVVGAGAVVAVMTTIDAIGGAEVEDSNFPWTILLFAAPWVVGVMVRRRRLAADRAERAAEDAERALIERRARAVTEERLRVAGELTDLVAHSLAAVAIQTAAARHRAVDVTQERRLAPVEEASRSALANLRALLDVLRADTDDEADVAPAPGLSELVELVASHRRDHGPVHLEVDPVIVQESASLRLVAYRVVQEALTNIGRYAPGAETTVSLRLADGRVEVVVEDDGLASRPTPPVRSGGGLGLLGMRERVSLHGGSLEAGALATGGFRVLAQLERGAAP